MRLSMTLSTGLLARTLVTWAVGSTSGKTLCVDDALYAGDINAHRRAGWSDFAVVSLRWPESSGP